MRTVKIVQLIAPQWDGQTGRTYTLHGLDAKGIVYRFSGPKKRWIPYPMKIGVPDKEVKW